MNHTEKENPVCKYCKGSEVLMDAYAAWNKDEQRWELSSLFDAVICETCGGETRLEWVAA
jgi:hypothetical protein